MTARAYTPDNIVELRPDRRSPAMAREAERTDPAVAELVKALARAAEDSDYRRGE